MNYFSNESSQILLFCSRKIKIYKQNKVNISTKYILHIVNTTL